MKDILTEIVKLREARGWSEYQLAEKAGLPQSTISSWYRKRAQPSVSSLEKICDTFGISMSYLFAEEEYTIELTKSQKELLSAWGKMNNEQQDAFLSFLKRL